MRFTTFSLISPIESVRSRRSNSCQAGQPFVPHQHQEVRFRQPFWFRRVEARRAVLDGVATVRQQRLAGLQLGATKLLGGQALDGVAIDPGDPGGKGGRRHAAS
jgi:hypothetical protein